VLDIFLRVQTTFTGPFDVLRDLDGAMMPVDFQPPAKPPPIRWFETTTLSTAARWSSQRSLCSRDDLVADPDFQPSLRTCTVQFIGSIAAARERNLAMSLRPW